MPTLKKLSSWTRTHSAEIGIAIIFLLIGVSLGIAINWTRDFSFAFEDKIEPADLIAIVVNVLLVVMIAHILDKAKQSEQSSKSAIQTRIRELHTFVSNFSDQVEQNDFEFTTATSSIKRIRTGIKTIRKLIETADLEVAEAETKTLEDATGDLDNLLTNEPVRDQSDDAERDISVKDGLCTCSSTHIKKLNEAFDNLKDLLLTFEVKINLL